jgi:hypothetical protein
VTPSFQTIFQTLGEVTSKLVRMLGVGLIVVGTMWLGETPGLRHVEADVYRTLRVSVQTLAALLQGEPHPAGPRVVVINGQQVHTDLGRVPLSPHEVLAVLEARAQSVMAAARPAAGDTIHQDRAVPQALAVAMHRPFRLEGPGWGAYGRLASAIPIADQGGQDVASLPPFGGGFLVLAVETAQGQSSDVWTWRFSPTWNPLAMLSAPGEDAPGIDLPGISRYPGSRRVFSLAERSAAGEAHVVAYEGGSSLAEHVRYYDELFHRLGLRALRGKDSPVPEPTRVMREYTGKGQEVAVFITRDAERPGRVLDVSQVRLPTRGG